MTRPISRRDALKLALNMGVATFAGGATIAGFPFDLSESFMLGKSFASNWSKSLVTSSNSRRSAAMYAI